MSTETLTPEVGEYGDEHIKTLRDAAHIRHRPGMYIGNTDIEGMHHLVWEVVYNSVDEALAGHCNNITVVVHADESISIADDGRGIPVGVKESGKTTLEEALTIAGSSGKFDNAAYRTSAGLHGMGAKAMNALSEWCEAEVRRDGRAYKMEFERGVATSGLQDLGPAAKGQTGTTITFKPDPEKFGNLVFLYDKLATRLQQIAFLNKKLRLSVRDERDGQSATFYSEIGIPDYVAFLNTGEGVEHAPPIYISKTVDGVTVELCFQYTTGDDRQELCFTNNAYNKDGGTHLTGFKTGLTRAIKAYDKKAGLFKEGLEPTGDDFREGLTAVININHPKPSFESQTKVKLTSAEVEGQVSGVLYEGLSEYLEKNPNTAKAIGKKVALAAEARLAAKKAREAIKDRKSLLGGGGLPGKLMDCTTKDRDQSELFLVEGDSAGGSAESGRDRYYQAVLPLRGKVLNVEKAKPEKLLKNNEITALIAAIGIDILNVEDVSKLRYGKVIILTDADVDGQHIRTLLLTFFFRQMQQLVRAGNLFVARPPLYKVTQKKEARFVQTREEMVQELMTRGLKATALRVTKPDAAERTLASDDLTRMLPVLNEVEAAVVNLERRGHTLASFLQRGRDGVLPVFHVRFGLRDYWFHTRDEIEAFRAEQSKKLGKELVLASDINPAGQGEDKPDETPAEQYTLDEWHEVRSLNKSLGKLREAGFEAADLVPLPRVAGREPPVRFTVTHDDSRRDLADLVALTAAIRAFGEKGIAVTRFKGLGEMDPEELWDTTLDPARRTLLKVTMNDVQEAEKMFRKLMGEDVEQRRDFIFKHSINSTEDIDYGA